MLPVESVVPQIQDALEEKDVILVAPPGAGKSTCLPLKLLAQKRFSGSKIIMLQPRRVAVRAIASYLAAQLGENVGETIGYRIRGESRVSSKTRLEIVTEGLLTRKIQNDPELAGVGLILFDEFHERSVHADFSLALSLEVQQSLRDDLRLLIMSATLDVLPIQKLLPGAEVIRSEGRQYPVDFEYRPLPGPSVKLVDWAATVVQEALEAHCGNVLVFLPGSWEIDQLTSRLSDIVADDTDVYPLYGSLDKARQQAAIGPTPEGRRKVVLATNIAETSLTIEGISVVVDSGLEKCAHFHLARGITRLRQQMISQASSIQRAGRAGRVQAGTCYRLWEQEKQSRLAAQSMPQILDTDLAPFLIEAAMWGSDIGQLSLLDKPTEAQIEQAHTLLLELKAMDKEQRLTPHGKKLASLGCHPRLANMLVNASALEPACLSLACLMVAALESQTLRSAAYSVRLSSQLEKLAGKKHDPVVKSAQQWAKRMNTALLLTDIGKVSHWTSVLLAFAYPDQIARNRGNGRLLLLNGTGATLEQEDPLASEKWLVVADMLLSNKADARVLWAEATSKEQVTEYFSHLFEEKPVYHWDEEKRRIDCRTKTMLGAIELSSTQADDIDQAQVNQIWCQVIRKKGIALFGLSSGIASWLHRAQLAHNCYPELWPAMGEQSLLDNLEEWLFPYLEGVTKLEALQSLDWGNVLKSQLDYQQQQQLQEWFPDKLTVPTGNRHALRYEGDIVTLSVRMQEMYGASETPTIAKGKIPVQIELLSPAGRPLRKTQDLAGFWKGSYAMVQKEMKGRYPKHYWPDDPASAVATTKTKKNM